MDRLLLVLFISLTSVVGSAQTTGSSSDMTAENTFVRIEVIQSDNRVEQLYGSPFSAHIDDPNVPEPGWYELNATVNSNRTSKSQTQLPLIDANVGYQLPFFKLKCQLKAEIPLVTTENKNENVFGGEFVKGDSSVGSKCIVYNNEAKKVSFAIYPEYDWSENGMIQHFRIPLLTAKEWDQVSVTGNLGYNKGMGNGAKSFMDGGIGVGHRLNDVNAVFAGAYYTAEDHTKWLEVGFRRKMGDADNLNIGVSRTVGTTPYPSGVSGKTFSISWQHYGKLSDMIPHFHQKSP